jgi:hypothetical protein
MNVQIEKERSWKRHSSLFMFVAVFLFFYLYHIRQGIDTDFFGVSIRSSTEEVAKIWIGGGDFETVFQSAVSWYKYGILNDPYWTWVTNIWPPGMTFINYVVISVVGFQGKFIAALIAINSGLWSLVFIQVYKSEKTWLHRMVFFLGSSYLLSSWIFEEWVMGKYFALSSGFAVPFFLLAIISADTHRLRLFSSSALAFSALTRVTSNLVVQITCLTALILIVVGYAHPKLSPRLPRLLKSCNALEIRKRGTRILLLVLLPIFVVEGWTSYVTKRAHPENRAYTMSVDGLFHGMRWRTSDDLNSIGGGFIVSGTGNWACGIEPDRCAEIAEQEAKTIQPYSGTADGFYTGSQLKDMAINALVNNPIAYIEYRAPSFWKFWSNGNLMYGMVMAVIVLLAISFALIDLLRTTKIQPLLYLIFIGVNIAPLFYIHLQLNYVFPIQIVSALYLMVNSENVRIRIRSVINRSRNRVL